MIECLHSRKITSGQLLNEEELSSTAGLDEIKIPQLIRNEGELIWYSS